VQNDLAIELVPHLANATHRREIANCWMDVANSGGAVGFPFPPVCIEEVSNAVKELATEIESGHVVLIEARRQEALAGWVTIRKNESPLTAHWATIARLQSHPTQRTRGIGVALLKAAEQHAHKIGLDHLHLALRGGEGLEAFYVKAGWTEIGRHRNALRLSANDYRDEVLMAKSLAK
jgi:GNAT superfamily N-acetyltransferase